MVLKPLYGAMNNTIAKMIAGNAPKYSKIVEPFADKGTFALFTAKKPAIQHVVNIVDPEIYAAMVFAQSYTASDFSALKKMDWVSSPDAFDAASAITDIEGVNFIYHFLYLKKFGMKMLGAESVSYDVLSFGKNIKNSIYAFPLMKALLKKVTFVNGDPMSLIPSDGFMILVPPPDQVEAVKVKLKGLSGSFFFAAKEASSDAVVQTAEAMQGLNVVGQKVASIMMADYSLITNYDSKLVPIDLSEIDMTM